MLVGDGGANWPMTWLGNIDVNRQLEVWIGDLLGYCLCTTSDWMMNYITCLELVCLLYSWWFFRMCIICIECHVETCMCTWM